MDYKRVFTRILTESPYPVSTMDQGMGDGQPPMPSDEEAWNQNNKNIVDNEELSNQFSVEGLPVNVTEKYVSKIADWRQNIEQVADKMEEIYTFATESADKPGAGEIFSSIGGLVEGIMTDFGTLNGQLRSLGNKIKVSMKRAQEKEQGRR